MRTRVYVDGFNLYYGALKDTSFKWLNLAELTRRLLPAGYAVDKLNYFTARVSGASDPGAPARQHSYLSALGTLPEVQVHFGRFLAKTAWRPLTNLPVADRRIDTPAAVTLPAGNHPGRGFTNPSRGQLSHGKRGKEETAQDRCPPDRCGDRRGSHHGRERFGCKPRSPSFERCLERVVRGGSCDLERY